MEIKFKIDYTRFPENIFALGLLILIKMVCLKFMFLMRYIMRITGRNYYVKAE